MDSPHAVQVVLGEGQPGILRFILEAEGFHVVGQARGEVELRRVLAVTHPSVIVLDAGISATAALDARTRTDGTPLVVVWPSGVRTALAEERVDPGAVIQDLGAAVRRAATRMPVLDDVVVVEIPDSPTVEARAEAPAIASVWRPEEEEEEEVRELEDLDRSERRPPPAGRAKRRVLAVAAAWTLALTASAAIGLAVPRAFDLFTNRRGTPHAPRVAPSDPRPGPTSVDRIGRAETSGTAVTPDGRACGRSEERIRGPKPERGRAVSGRPDDPGRGCGAGSGKDKDKGKDKDPKPRGERGSDGKGKPVEPGARGQGNGRDGERGADDRGGDRSGSSGDGSAAGDHGPADAEKEKKTKAA